MFFIIVALVLVLAGVFLLISGIMKGQFNFMRIIFGLILMGVAVYIYMASVGAS